MLAKASNIDDTEAARDLQKIVLQATTARRNAEQKLARLNRLPYRLFATYADKVQAINELILAHVKEQAALTLTDYSHSEEKERQKLNILLGCVGLKLKTLFTKKEIESDDLSELNDITTEAQNECGIALSILEQRMQAVESAQKKVDGFGGKTNFKQRAAVDALTEAERRLQIPHFSDLMLDQEKNAKKEAKTTSHISQEKGKKALQKKADYAAEEVARLSRKPGSLFASTTDKIKAMQDLMLARVYHQAYSTQASPDQNEKSIEDNTQFKSLFNEKERSLPEVAELGAILEMAERKKVTKQLEKLEKVKTKLGKSTDRPSAHPTPSATHPITHALTKDINVATQATEVPSKPDATSPTHHHPKRGSKV